MKYLLITFAFISFTVNVSSQEHSPDLQLTSEAYMAKSKAQKETGWILLGVGTASVGSGLLLAGTLSGNIGNDISDGYYGALLITAGVITDLISIPFFTAATKNKKRAMKAVTSVKFEDVPSWSGVAQKQSSVPALSVKVRF